MPFDLFCQLGIDPQCAKYYWDSGILNCVIRNFDKQSINGTFIELFDIQFKVPYVSEKNMDLYFHMTLKDQFGRICDKLEGCVCNSGSYSTMYVVCILSKLPALPAAI